MKKVIIVGASSGIGYQLAKIYSSRGAEVGIAAPELDLLENLQSILPNRSYVKQIDVSNPTEARSLLADLVTEMGGMDILVISAGKGPPQPTWEVEMEIIEVNIAGFTALANWAFQYFEANGGGQLAGISSVASLRGRRIGTVYSASKAYINSYLEGLQQLSVYNKKGVTVTAIRPGFVATPMVQGNTHMFWVATAEKAAMQIYKAIEAKKRIAYVTRRWWLVAQVLKSLPDFVWLRT